MADSLEFKAEGDRNQQAGRDITTNITNNYEYLSTKLPSRLAEVIFVLEKQLDTPINSTFPKTKKYEIDEKISYNNVIKYQIPIQDYGNYSFIIENIYEDLDNHRPNSKKRFLDSINRRYGLIVGQLLKDTNNQIDRVKVIQQNSDYILDTVFGELKKNYLESDNSSKIMLEDLETCLIIIVCHSFIICKILEEPQKQ